MRGAGADVRPVRTLPRRCEAALPEVDRVIVDLTARAYDGIAAIEVAAVAGRPVLAVGQHDDAELRRRALAAGADRVHPYRRLYERRPGVVAAWLAASPTATRRRPHELDPTDPSPPSDIASDWRPPATRDGETGLAALLVGVGADLRYLTGYPRCRSSA